MVGVKALSGASPMMGSAAEMAATMTASAAGGMTASGARQPPVTFFPHDQVSAAFAKGAVLLDGSDGRNYMIHASRRDQPGMAEVHVKDTDVIYVLDGSARFVTGGTVVDGKTTAPDEIRGTAIRGGETRRITKGDVITVASGTPHWFQQVDGVLTYYVVKVR